MLYKSIQDDTISFAKQMSITYSFIITAKWGMHEYKCVCAYVCIFLKALNDII